MLASGLSYFGQIGNSDYDVAIQAAASDSSINIIQRPRIQTFQAKPAQFFVGNTVPYVTSTYNGGTTGIGSSYSQLSVGVSLDVTPFINPDGLVVMEIQQEIDDITGYTRLTAIRCPTRPRKRCRPMWRSGTVTPSSSAAPFIRKKISTRAAFRCCRTFRCSARCSVPAPATKTRNELLVLMRPTVLKTPELASLQAKTEESRLPGIAHAESEDNKEALKEVEAEEKARTN